ncbi:MAG TPA: MFS transporter [Steroidobacteraceae bacterium]|nr:MFS transporter [Steroidobacteraceae bacterium]
MRDNSQFRLLTERRFLPFFGAQALGAFNDNLYKNVLVILATYQIGNLTSLDPQLLTNLAGGLFILPYVLLSGIAGQLADRLDKALVLKVVKAAEILIMGLAGLGFAQRSIELLLAALFLMGVHSTFFAPAKYGLLPQVLRERELVGGNALVEMGTFVAILLGTLGAGLLVAPRDPSLVAWAVIAVAGAGFVVSLGIPKLAPLAPGLRIDWNPFTSTWANIKVAAESRTILLSLLGISWFWFYGALVLAQLPLYAKLVLNGEQQIVTLLLVTFSVGVGLGSLLCERLSGHKVEIGLVPFGSIGLTVFAVDLYFATPPAASGPALTLEAFLAQPYAWRILADLGLVGLFGGFFIVPLYALVQQRARPEELSRIIAANSILNAAFIVAAALLGAALLEAGLTIPELLLLTGVLNAFVAVYIYTLVPEFLLRFLAWLLIHAFYRLRVRGIENVPESGAALLASNHVSFADALVISAACRRPIRFVMDHGIFRIPVLSWVFRGMKAIPIASRKEHPQTLERAFEEIARELRAGHLVCIFPEGRLTPDGELGEFRPGIMRALEETPVPVVPMALTGLWGSVFSRKEKKLWRRFPRGFASRIGLTVGEAVHPGAVTPDALRARVLGLKETTEGFAAVGRLRAES